MTVAEMIKKTRMDNNMTQEEYANKFYISRQTVSSWENGRSMPELQTLIDICNTYKMSLDVLLNDDSRYVKRISMIQRVVKRMKYILTVIIVLLCAFLIYYGVWNVRNSKMIDEYNEKVLSLGYVRDGKTYELHDKNITYHAGKQELPKLKWDFINKSLSAYYNDGEMIWDISLRSEKGVGYFYFQVNVDSSIAGTISSDGVIEYTEVSGLAQKVLEDNKVQIEKIIKTMNHQWEVIYN